ncbi:MAG: phosphate ABC transporter substrate-binding protein PstS, partial [Acidimicrobiales bacterium]
MKNRLRRLLLPLAVLASFALVAAACGDDDDSASDDAETAEAGTTGGEAGGAITEVEGSVN